MSPSVCCSPGRQVEQYVTRLVGRAVGVRLKDLAQVAQYALQSAERDGHVHETALVVLPADAQLASGGSKQIHIHRFDARPLIEQTADKVRWCGVIGSDDSVDEPGHVGVADDPQTGQGLARRNRTDSMSHQHSRDEFGLDGALKRIGLPVHRPADLRQGVSTWIIVLAGTSMLWE